MTGDIMYKKEELLDKTHCYLYYDKINKKYESCLKIRSDFNKCSKFGLYYKEKYN